jgi:hypothetical protein
LAIEHDIEGPNLEGILYIPIEGDELEDVALGGGECLILNHMDAASQLIIHVQVSTVEGVRGIIAHNIIIYYQAEAILSCQVC